jgi:hypothetical protein
VADYNESEFAKVPTSDDLQRGAHLKIPAPQPPATQSPSTQPQSSNDTGGKK